MSSAKFFTSVLRVSKIKQIRSNVSIHYCTQNVTSGVQSNIEKLFLCPDVQRILQKITAVDYEKVFATSKKPLEPHKYEFVTDKRLKQLQENATLEAKRKLQMPPVMSIRKPIDQVLSKDPELQGYLKDKFIFTDISPNVSSRDRQITVREVDGTLRKASWEERDRMNQIFYPMPGRSLEIPKLFESSNLDRLLEEGSYKFVLDCACVQFEPDDPEYHRVTKTTYEHIKRTKKFDDLRSTRHFGPMAFYFACTRDIATLLVDMIERQLLSDAFDTIKLCYLIHENLGISNHIDETDQIGVIEDYIENHSLEKDNLKSVLQTYIEQISNSQVSN